MPVYHGKKLEKMKKKHPEDRFFNPTKKDLKKMQAIAAKIRKEMKNDKNV